MDYTTFMNAMFHYGSILLAVMAMLVFATTIIVEVIKGLFPKVPTNIVAVIVALIVTVLAAVILCAVLEITPSVRWCLVFSWPMPPCSALTSSRPPGTNCRH